MVRCCCCGGAWVGPCWSEVVLQGSDYGSLLLLLWGPCWSEVVLQGSDDGSLLLLWRCLGGSLLV